MIEQAELRALLESHWGIVAAEVTELAGELDRTYRVLAESGSTYCVKTRGTNRDAADDSVDNAVDSAADLEFDVLTHLQAQSDVAVPTLVPAASGAFQWTDEKQVIWVLDWVDGMRWADLPWRSPALARQLGHQARLLSRSLAEFDHPAAHRTHHWDLRRLDESIALHQNEAASDRHRAAVDRVRQLVQEVEPLLAELPQSVVHQDLNDHNVLVRMVDGEASVAGIIDFGDVLHSATIAELAVAVAYATLRTEHPIDAAAGVVAGWQGDEPLDDAELRVIFPLALGRLMVNALTWSARSAAQPEYADARSRHTWQTIEKLVHASPRFVEERFRTTCGVVGSDDGSPADSTLDHYRSWKLIDLDPRQPAFDGIDPHDGDAMFQAACPERPFAVRHNTVRADRSAHADGNGGPATVQLGVQLHQAEGTQIAIPSAGTVAEASAERVVVRHENDWCSVWSGLTHAVSAGERIEAGAVIGASGSTPVGVQLLRFVPSPGDHVSTFVRPVDRTAWVNLSVDPASWLGLVDDGSGLPPIVDAEVRNLRNERLAASQRYYYREPMTLVRASGVTFFDANGHRYLDAINNVTHVGHGNERVAQAASRQLRQLNTNSRFVYEQMGAYADRLAALLPDPLNVVFLVCTGSEANDLALRISRQVTGREDIMVVDGAYHGNTTAVTGISPNRYKGPGGEGPPPTTHEVMQPNLYRGPHGYGDTDAGTRYAESVREVADGLVADARPPAAFVAESLMGTAGQVVYPPGYLTEAFAAVRGVGGLCISDEVQVGFGRLGTDFWGFQQGGVVPDIVTMGKPMGNGQPIAAVVTTREIADAFDQGMKYFNTFGGNPVSCAIADAVLDEIEDRGLQEHARHVGGRFLRDLRSLMGQHERIGDVRGEGLYLGVEFVRDRATKEPNAPLTAAICERMRERGVIVYPNGVHGNCLKIKPPMTFSDADTDFFVGNLEFVLHELPPNS